MTDDLPGQIGVRGDPRVDNRYNRAGTAIPCIPGTDGIHTKVCFAADGRERRDHVPLLAVFGVVWGDCGAQNDVGFDQRHFRNLLPAVLQLDDFLRSQHAVHLEDVDVATLLPFVGCLWSNAPCRDIVELAPERRVHRRAARRGVQGNNKLVRAFVDRGFDAVDRYVAVLRLGGTEGLPDQQKSQHQTDEPSPIVSFHRYSSPHHCGTVRRVICR